MNKEDLKNKTVLILGAGKTGIASAFFLIDKAKKILLSELKDKACVEKNILERLISSGVEVEFNENSNEFIKKADLVVISPGISPNSDVIKKINDLNKPIVSDIELASKFITKPIIGVTGTNGKTTTTSLIAHLLNTSGKKAIACGNIGKPLIEITNQDKNIDYFVLEISSFQIYYSPTLSCKIAVCLNITPDHLDWHGNLTNYIESKKRLFLQQDKNSYSVLNFSDNLLKNFNLKNNVYYFSFQHIEKSKFDSMDNLAFFENEKLKIKTRGKINEIINKAELKLLGSHNIENALASIAVCNILNLPLNKIASGLKSFQGVEHRLEFVKKVNNKEFYNDSKATNPEATIKAIEAFKNKNVTLILGGKDKKTELKEMIKAIKECVEEVIIFGEAKERFQQELTKNNYKKLIIVNTLDEAVKSSLKSNTEIILFSPACSSFDMFKNYEERGKIFKQLVNNH